MAFRLRPLHEDKLHFADLSNTQILILALEASQKLEWNIEGIALREVIFYVPMGMRSQGEEVTFTIEEGNSGEISVRSQCASVQLVDYGKNRKNIQKLQETMEEIKSTLTPEELAQKANELEEDLTRPLTEEERRLQAESEKESSFIHFFIPRKGFIATPVLIDINILVFILMAATGAGILEPSTLALLNWGADFGPLTLTGDWWRAVTCNFVHIGAFHLLMNMYAFIYIGIWLEHLIGTRRMFVSYLLTGLCSAVFSLYMHAETISAGASGSIFGLYGIFLAFLLFHAAEGFADQYPYLRRLQSHLRHTGRSRQCRTHRRFTQRIPFGIHLCIRRTDEEARSRKNGFHHWRTDHLQCLPVQLPFTLPQCSLDISGNT